MRKLLTVFILLPAFSIPASGQLITTCQTDEVDGQTVTRCDMLRVKDIERQPDQNIRYGKVGLYKEGDQAYMAIHTQSFAGNFADVDSVTFEAGGEDFNLALEMIRQIRDTRAPSLEKTRVSLEDNHLQAIGKGDTTRLKMSGAVLLLQNGELEEHANQLLE